MCTSNRAGVLLHLVVSGWLPHSVAGKKIRLAIEIKGSRSEEYQNVKRQPLQIAVSIWPAGREIIRPGPPLKRTSTTKCTGSSPHRERRRRDEDGPTATGFSAALHRAPPPPPPALLRRLGVKETTGVGKVIGQYDVVVKQDRAQIQETRRL
ncbi:unnamed protein product [Diatraea saccharalis]|uniref:Uncharacterized protein n=1 Tax=Diatraea saccharalis TaxID=40085 RepID=A0A9N9QXL6_9NEOP|nr:unnamed protein product [Diatraea saccharalis]